MTDDEEIEANDFAIILLIPRHFIERDIRKFISADGDLIPSACEQLAKRYRVSEPLMRYRLTSLSYIEPL